MKICYLLLVCFLVSCSYVGIETTDPDSGLNYVYQNKASFEKVNFEAKEYKLKNGLKLVVIPRDDVPIVSYYTMVRIGSRHESEGMTGASHFLEHLMFKGTEKYPDGQYDKLIESYGGITNAFTTFDSTVYYVSSPVDKLEEIISLEADRLVNLKLDNSSFEKERKVIQEERKLRLENSVYGKLYNNMFKESFRNSPYGHSVLGKKKDISKVSAEQIKAFYKKYYSPNNTVVFVVGDVSEDRVFNLVKRYYGTLPKQELPDMDSDFKVRGAGIKRLDIRGMSKEPIVMMSYLGAAEGTFDSHALDLITSLLGDGKSSFLQKSYVESNKPIFSSLHAGNIAMNKSGLIFTSGQLLPKVGIHWIEKNMRKKFRKSCKKSINERNLQMAKNRYLVELMGSLSTNSGIANYLVNVETSVGDYSQYKSNLRKIANISKEEALEICKKYISSKRGLFISIWNKNPIRKVR